MFSWSRPIVWVKVAMVESKLCETKSGSRWNRRDLTWKRRSGLRSVEPRRVCRRLPFLRRWSNEQTEDKTALFAGGARARCADGVRQPGPAFLAMGGDRRNRRQDRLFGADAA